ncbi:NHLP leader peptide family natural product precursor [Calothrix sp. FACHB-1219]|uniref:NHLP leader peptide family RiPP precursor n=1 Tax=unclassified Calothrix TaxID=2619626 RepID=UPI001686DFEB|nr:MULTISPECIES: NHLP leader peptide family RiPP precursor [unclassified Calothrix]MBD2207952.1 NHLP leader peptide family natural product precursor [Calothrix sp. FACHB-168]MBD2222504.1 NHLP leader peptide family natural product precursor [Calothrix sp. FACHB-1219]
MSTNSEALNPQQIQERVIAKAMEDSLYKQRLLNDTKAVLEEELGEKLPEDLTVQILQQSPKNLYLLLPIDIDELVRDGILSESELESVAGGWVITVGVGVATPYAAKQSPKISRAVKGWFK